MGNRPQSQTGTAGVTQTDGFAGKPFRTPMLPHMHHQLTAMDLFQPEVLRQVAMRRRKVWGMQIRYLFGVVAPVGLDHHNDPAEAQPVDGEAI